MSQAHPTDEQLSAALDGQDDGAGAHAAECSSCQARQAELRDVMALVGAPVVVDPAAREAAVAAALRAGVGDDFMSRGEIGVGAQRRGVNWAPIAAIAAVFVLALLAVPRLISTGSDDDKAGTTAAARDAQSAAVDEVGATEGGDLGEVADGFALRDRVAGALGVSALQSDDQAEAGGTVDTATSPDAAPMAAESSTRRDRDPARCSGVARREYGTGLGALVYSASVRFKAIASDGGASFTPGVVLAYELAEPGPQFRYRVFVLAESDCRLLNSVSL